MNKDNGIRLGEDAKATNCVMWTADDKYMEKSVLVKKEEGLRYNDGKARYDLLEPYAIEQLVKVFTQGSLKYKPRNWELGMSWSSVLASLKRHIAAFEKGEDFDKESGNYHMAHAAWNALALVSYYKLAPTMDDRQHSYLNTKKIGLDIDGLLADFLGHLGKVSGNKGHMPSHWNCPLVRKEFDKVKHDPEFWANIPPLLKKEDIPFEPKAYITARSIDPEVTQTWLDKFGFPKAKLYCVGVGDSKVEVAKEAGIDIFVDDSYENFLELTKAGIFTYLYDAPYNQKYEVGYRRIKSLKELV